MQPFLCKVFENIKRVTFGEDMVITEMFSGEGEKGRERGGLSASPYRYQGQQRGDPPVSDRFLSSQSDQYQTSVKYRICTNPCHSVPSPCHSVPNVILSHVRSAESCSPGHLRRSSPVPDLCGVSFRIGT